MGKARIYMAGDHGLKGKGGEAVQAEGGLESSCEILLSSLVWLIFR